MMQNKRPILIAGPTASGKSALALALAQRLGGAIINADALQVYAGWRVLTARPDAEDLARAPHHLYGHVAMDRAYSVGEWLRDVAALLPALAAREQVSIIVGGTGLYFSALTNGLAEIPPVPPQVRAEGDALRKAEGAAGLVARLEVLDPQILTRIDRANPMRLQRAWEVVTATKRPLSQWQTRNAPPLLPEAECCKLLLWPERDWLADRIAQRFAQMVEGGALEEVQANHDAGYDPQSPAMRALGAAELAGYCAQELSHNEMITRAIVATRQYAKRQRSWFRGRMGNYRRISPLDLRESGTVDELVKIWASKPLRDEGIKV